MAGFTSPASRGHASMLAMLASSWRLSTSCSASAWTSSRLASGGAVSEAVQVLRAARPVPGDRFIPLPRLDWPRALLPPEGDCPPGGVEIRPRAVIVRPPTEMLGGACT